MAASADLPAALELPDELFGLIVAKLPLQNMVRLRLVCKQWNHTLHDTCFLGKYFQLTRHAPLYLWPAEKGFAAYSPEVNRWHIWPTSFILMERSWYKVCGAAEGLLVVEDHDGSERALYLANPLTRSQRKIPIVPEIQDRCSSVLGMVFDERSKSYKIFAVNHGMSSDEYLYVYQGVSEDEEDDGCSCKLYMYDSEVDSWKMIGTWERGDMQDFDLPTFHQGVLHCLSTEYDSIQPIYRVFCFDGGKSWHQLTAQIPRGLLFVHLFEWQGNLMLIGGKGNGYSLSSVHVWQLDEEKNVWLENMTMPDDLLHRFFPTEPRLHRKFHCDSSADYVYLTSYSKHSMFGRRHVMCNLSKTSWWEVPELLSTSKRLSPVISSGGRLGSFLLKPSFDKIL